MHTLVDGGYTAGRARNKVELPPLILHPFNDRDPVTIAEAFGEDQPGLAELTARYAEMRMLCFIGKDLNRWLEHCVAVTSRNAATADITEAGMIGLLLFDPPRAVAQKLGQWGVENYPLVFARALGLNAVFPHPPGPDQVSPALLADFTLYADALFDTRLKRNPGSEASGEDFAFELYAAGEYTARLEAAWAALSE